MRYAFFYVYLASVVYLALVVLSDFFFGKGDAAELGRRMILVFIWPFAVLSRPGRKILFNKGKNL